MGVKFLTMLYYSKRSYIRSIVELFYLIRSQFEVTEIYYRGIYEHKRSLPNDVHLKIKFNTFNMRIDYK